MNEDCVRITRPGTPPNDREVSEWIGSERYAHWIRLTALIEANYAQVFTPEWLFGGRKHGWSLRYRKNKSFCTLIPEKNRFALLIVFGSKERTTVEAIRNRFMQRTMSAFDDAKTFHDGKWVLLVVDDEAVLADVMRLLAVKRKPRK